YAAGQMVDHLGFGEDGADAANLHRLFCPQRVGADVARLQSEIARRLLQKRAGASRAFVVETEGAHSPLLVDTDGLDVLTADVQNRAHIGEVMAGCDSV